MLLFDHQAFFIQTVGGISKYHAALYEHLNKLGFPCDLPVYLSENEYLSNGVYAGWFASVRFKGKSRFLNLVNNLQKQLVKNQLKDSKYKIFHPTYYDAYFLPAMRSQKLVLTVHDMVHEKFPDLVTDNTHHRVVKNKRSLLEHADLVIAISVQTKLDIVEVYPDVPSEKIKVVYHACEFKGASTPGIILPDKYILYVGGRKGYKNFYPFLREVAEYSHENPACKILLVGNPLDKEEQVYVSKLRLNDRIITYRAKEDELFSLYKNAFCFVFSSAYEGFGLPVLEAQSAGCPAVLNNISVFREIAPDGSCVYYDQDEKGSLGTALKMLENKAVWDSVVFAGKQNASRFTWDQVALNYIDIYNSI